MSAWWRGGVLYQVYPRSFADANGDGIGDLAGAMARLDHLQWLGVDGIWLSPTYPSPNADWGYDVADYYGVHPDLGTLDDLDRLLSEARRRGIRVLLDLVANHTSDRHPWFRERPEYYVWAETVPNNWTAGFGGGSAWQLDPTRGRYYLHQFAPEQPDLDWWNLDVREEFDRILRFWFDRGIAGFRIDMANTLVKDRELRDNVDRLDHQRNRPEVHDVLRHWQSVARTYDPKPLLIGETYVPLADLPAYYGNGTDELDLAFNFDFLNAPFHADALRPIVEETERELPQGAWPVWTLSNHDHSRVGTRWAEGDELRARAALFLLLTLRGTPVLYQGDEIALTDAEVPAERVLDIAPVSRDRSRTPLPWTRDGGEWRDPWLPLLDTSRNVEDQRADAHSTLSFVRALIQRRRSFALAPYEPVEAADGVWAYRRGDAELAVNLSDEPRRHRGRTLEAWETWIS